MKKYLRLLSGIGSCPDIMSFIGHPCPSCFPALSFPLRGEKQLHFNIQTQQLGVRVAVAYPLKNEVSYPSTKCIPNFGAKSKRYIHNKENQHTRTIGKLKTT
jgi:hypothetical protein